MIHQSPPLKRPSSPVPAASIKKVKVEQATLNPKKKQPPPPPPPAQPVIKNETSSKTTVNNINMKKSQFILSTKPSPTVEEKPTKTIPVKDSTSNGTIEG